MDGENRATEEVGDLLAGIARGIRICNAQRDLTWRAQTFLFPVDQDGGGAPRNVVRGGRKRRRPIVRQTPYGH